MHAELNVLTVNLEMARDFPLSNNLEASDFFNTFLCRNGSPASRATTRTRRSTSSSTTRSTTSG
eukprot:12098673-Prorocentrum_lima.AAC.1